MSTWRFLACLALLYCALLCAWRYVEQTRFETLGSVPNGIVVFDHLRARCFIANLPPNDFAKGSD